MKYEAYSGFEFNEDFSEVEFVSVGKNGPIHKRITFTETEYENVYNLTFGDVDENGEINDFSVSNNGDRNKILATVVKVVVDYTKLYPTRWILISGSTKGRTRLYRMVAGINLEELSETFDIYAFVNEELVLFSKNMEINAFVIKRKNV